MTDKEKYPCPNCNREIFPGTTTCPYCETPLTIFKYARSPVNHLAELDKAAKALISDVSPWYAPLLQGAGIVVSTFVGFLVFMAFNYAPFLVLPMEYVIGTVFLTLFPALVFNVGVTTWLGIRLHAWLHQGLFVRHQHHPKKPQLWFALLTWAFALSGGFCLWWLWPAA